MKSKKTLLLLLVLSFFVTFLMQKASPASHTAQAAAGTIATEPNLKIAFIGDQDLGSDPEAVLKVISDEKAQALVHLGDFDYADNPNAWDTQFKKMLIPFIPITAVVGNHDTAKWTEYKAKLQSYLNQFPDLKCTGEIGTRATCTFKGLFIITSGAGTIPSGKDNADQVGFIKSSLASSQHVWKLCTWHKNQNALQIGGKSDEVGFQPYQACIDGGAMILNGHEHSYERTKTITNAASQTIDPTCNSTNQNCVAPGKSFVIVQGLGGASIRDQTRCLPATAPYGCNGLWSKIYSSNQGAKHGALFIIFNYQGNPTKAHAYFKNRDGQIIDEFDITTDAAGNITPPTGTNSTATPTIPANCTKKSQGDADCNGLINLSDFETFRREYTATVNTKYADFDSNGSVNLADFETFRRTFTGGGGGITQQPPTPTLTNGPIPGGNATATVETTPVDNSGDAADDPAIWVNPSGQSFVLGTDKRGGGIFTYTLSGAKVGQAANGLRINNVDVRNGFNLNGQTVSLAVGSDRSGKIARFKINTDGTLTNVAGNSPAISFEPYGSCMYKSNSTGKYYVILTSNGSGTIKQYELTANAGKVDATEVSNNFSVITSQSEGCAGDDELGYIYIGEEANGIWRFGAEPGNNTAAKLIAPVNSQLKADVEGVSIVKTSNTTGYIFASSQGDSTFIVYKREGNNDFVKKFKVVSGSIDEVTGSDGIDTTATNLGSGFASGMFATQDNTNDSGNQNFKFVPLQQILGGSGLLPLEGFTDND